jgi:hypothetical protein
MNGFILIRNIVSAMVKKWMYLAQIHMLCMSRLELGPQMCLGVEQVQRLSTLVWKGRGGSWGAKGQSLH